MANNTLADNLKKYFYSGIGFASHASELVQKSMDEYVKAGKVSAEDGKGIVDNLLKGLEERKAGVEDKYNEAVHSFISFTTSEVGGLQQKIQSLEQQLRASGSKSGGNKKAAGGSKGGAKKTVSGSAKGMVKKIVKKAAAAKKAVAKKVAPAKKAVAKKVAAVKKAVAKKAAPVKKAVAKKAASKKSAPAKKK